MIKGYLKKITGLKYFYLIFNSIIFLLLTFILFQYFKNAIIVHDDIVDLMQNNVKFYHARYLTTFFSLFFIKILPNILGIHPQNFAVFSEGLLKVIIYNTLVIILSSAFFKFYNKKYSFLSLPTGIIYILTFFTTLSFVVETHITPIFETYAYFSGYLVPIIFFILFWYNNSILFFNNELDEEKIFKKFVIIQSFLCILTCTGNEILAFFSIIFMFLTIIDILITKRIKMIKYILTPLCISILTTTFVLTNDYSQVIYEEAYKLDIIIPSLKTIPTLFTLYCKTVFSDNIFLWLPVIASYLILIFVKDKQNINVIKYTSYLIITCLIFFALTLFLPRTCPYTEDNLKFWTEAAQLQYEFSCIMFLIILYLTGYISKLNNKDAKYLIYNILIFCSFMYIILYYKDLRIDLYTPEMKKNLYITDKIAVHYLRQNKPAIINIENKINYLIGEYVHLGDKYQNTIFKLQRYDFRYLGYLNTIYKVNIEPGIMYKNKESSENEFEKSGGTITEEELKKLDFSKI